MLSENLLWVYIFLFVCFCDGKKHTINWDIEIESDLQIEKRINVHINDWMDIMCPYISTHAQNKRDLNLYIDLFNVTEHQYNDCNGKDGQRVLKCIDPRKETKLTTKFQEKSPSPLGFIFQPGKTYYYLSKPSIRFKSLDTKGCKNTLKLKVYVHEKNNKHYTKQKSESKHHNRHIEDYKKSQQNLFRPAIKPIHSSMSTSSGHNNSNKLSTVTMSRLCVFYTMLVLVYFI